MVIALTYDELVKLKPCADDFRRVTRLMGGAKKWDGKKIDAASARKAGATYDDLVWAASAVARNNPDVERRLRLWLADCAARVLYIYEADPQADGRPRNAIVVARQFARGKRVLPRGPPRVTPRGPRGPRVSPRVPPRVPPRWPRGTPRVLPRVPPRWPRGPRGPPRVLPRGPPRGPLRALPKNPGNTTDSSHGSVRASRRTIRCRPSRRSSRRRDPAACD
jgi:hypothetical protein